MTTTTLSPTDQVFWDATHKVVITAADVAELSADAATLALFTAPVKTRVSLSAMVLNTAFDASDTAINSLLMEVGDDGDTDRYLASIQLAVDGTEILYRAPGLAANDYIYITENTVDVLLTAAGGANPTLAEINAGQVTLYFKVQDVNDLLQA